MRRSIAVVVLAQSAALALLLPMVDARAEIASGDVREHVEQPGSRECPPLHDEIACQLCRVLRLAASPAPSTIPIATSAHGVRVPVERRAHDPIPRIASSSSPRAPPRG